MDTPLIGAPRDMSGGLRPAILQRNDEDFIESTLEDLRSASGRQTLQGLLAATRKDGVLKLFQPIQRQFHLAVLEAWCNSPGSPPLDPAKVLSAGMVLRRVAGTTREGWMRGNGRVRGWLPLARIGGEQADPVVDTRLQRGLTGVAGIDRQLAGRLRGNPDNLLQETVIPLYLAPPDVRLDAGKTLYYGMVPTVSGELSEAAPQLADTGDDAFGPSSDFFRQHLAAPLQGLGFSFPFPGATLDPYWFDAVEMPGDGIPENANPDQWNALIAQPARSNLQAVAMREFIQLLRQLGGEFNAFEGGAEVTPLQRQLAAMRLIMPLAPGRATPDTVSAFNFLQQAAAVLLAKDSGVRAPVMPATWPALSRNDTDALCLCLHDAMNARFQAVKGKTGRYDDPAARYVLRAFLRMQCPRGGPPRVVWSAESEPFQIADWYEGAGAPPVQIRLPDPSNRDLLKTLKPNVAFVLPPALQNLLSCSAKDLMNGKPCAGPNFGLSWICSFNIPIITICAFIVLNIFLSLFNLIFGWMFFIKICIPFPKLGNKPPPSP